MKKILVLTSKYDVHRKNLLESLTQRFYGQAEVKLDFLENFTSIISKSKLQGFISGSSLSKFDLVYFSGKNAFLTAPKAIAMCLEASNIPFLGYTAYMGNKLTSLSKLAQNHINIPNTIFCAISTNNKIDLALIKELGFPVIIKNMKSHQMKGIFVVKNTTELKTFLTKKKDRLFLFQKFIHIKQEYRILVIGGKAVSAHTKVTRSYSNSNQKVGYFDPNQIYIFVDIKSLPKKLITEAEKASKILSLDVAGVDVCIDKNNKIYVIEVNRHPGIDSKKGSPEIEGLFKFIHQKTR